MDIILTMLCEIFLAYIAEVSYDKGVVGEGEKRALG